MPTNHSHIHNYCIADFNIVIEFADSSYNGVHLITSLESFQQSGNDGESFFSLYVDDTTVRINKSQAKVIGSFNTGNGDIDVEQETNSGAYQYIIKNYDGVSCCLLRTNRDFTQCCCALRGSHDQRQYGLNCALMLLFSMRGSYKDAILLHASVVRHNDLAYAFIAKSGTGKSTQVSSWLRYIENCDLLNDDSPVVRVIGDEAFIYGSPWSGKTPCYRNVKAKLAAITQINRAKENSVEPLSPARAIGVLLPACSSMRWDNNVFNNTCNIVAKLLERTKIQILHCLPNKEAALLCHKTIAR